jgi:hypothetical protein
MAIFYSASMKGFYPEFMKSDYDREGNWPDDVQEVSERWYNYLMDGQAEGKVIVPNEYGQPVLVEPPEPTREQLTANAQVQNHCLWPGHRGNYPLQDAFDLGLDTDEERRLLLAWKKYRVLLNRVDTETAPTLNGLNCLFKPSPPPGGLFVCCAGTGGMQ